MTVNFKIWGMERSGTNYVQRLLDANIKDANVHASDGGRKHGVVSRGQYGELPEDAAHVVVTKHPMPWLASFLDYYSDGQFTPRGALRIYSVTLDYWTAALPGGRSYILRYEDLLDDAEGEVFSLIASIEEAAPSQQYFTDIDEICAPGSGTHGGPPKLAFDDSKYTEERWRDNLSVSVYEAAIDWCAKWGFTEVFQEIGYDPFQYNFDHGDNDG